MRRLFAPYLPLPAGVWALFAAILVNRMGNFVYPFLTLYLTQKAGASPAQAGLFLMLLPLAVIPALLGGGWLADRWGRRRVLVTGQVLAGTCYVAAAFFPLGPAVPVFMVAATFLANLAQIGHNAMLNDLTTTHNRKAAFSLNYLGINIGFSLGPLLAGVLFTENLTLFFLLDGLSTWGSAVLVFLFTRETLGEEVQGPRAGGEARAHDNVFRALAERPFFLAFLGVGVLGTAVYYQHSFSLPLQLAADFGAEGPRVYGLLMAVNAFTVVVFSTVLTRLTARFASLPVIAGAAVLYAVGFGFSGLFGGVSGAVLGLFLGATVVWTFGEILASVASHVYQSSQTPENHRGKFSSVRAVFQNGAQALTSAVSGLFIGAWGVGAVWPAVAVLAAGQAGLLLTLHRLSRRR